MLTTIIPQIRRLPLKTRALAAMYSSNVKGGDNAGSIREAGGSFGKREQAQEAQYFNKLQQEQLKKLKSTIDDDLKHHEEEIKRHQEAIAKKKKIAEELSK